ncbi:MAG: LacI family DNA-binding transcriptional regulator [Fibrella sp.]|nr:LacI family DNA-binding transcriptional regulator [Armatimonadota bacterium]
MQDTMEKTIAAVTAPTLADVARRAGVNKITASVVMNGAGQGNTRVSDATRQRVLTAAKELHYQPNALAKSLRHRKTNIMGFYIAGYIDTRDLFLSEIVSGLHQACEQNQRDFLVHGTFRGTSVDDIYAEILNGKVDGLVLFVESGNALAPRLAASHLPVVAIANAESSMACVTGDDVSGSRMQVAYLARRGHRHVVYAVSPYNFAAPARRFESFLAAAQEADLRVTPYAIPSGENRQNIADTITELLALPPSERPTAIVCWHDTLAFRIVEHLRKIGVHVPDDMAVIGYDGSTTLIPPAFELTTVRVPWREVAGTAVNLLCQTKGKPPVGETILPVEWIAGETA